MALVEHKPTDPTRESPEALIREARELQYRRRRRRAAAGVVGLLVLAGGGIAFFGGGGTSAAPAVDGSPPAGIAARAADPAGGLAWGIRIVRATGWTCVQLGRLRGDQLGVLGQDGSFGDDGRFHPFGPSTTTQAYCGQNDANGHAFLNVRLVPLPASGQGAGYRTLTECHPAADIAQAKQALSNTGRSTALRIFATWAACPNRDLRFVQYGLLGPEATSVTYTVDGRTETEPTRGPDGAYLVAGPGSPNACARAGLGSDCGGSGPGYSPQISSGLITAVQYRNGRTCHLTPSYPGQPALLVSCRRIGYVPERSPFGEPQVRAPVSARVITAKHWCFTRHDQPINLSGLAPVIDTGPYIPCDGPVPANEIRDPADTQGTLIVFSWTAREPVTSATGEYEWSIHEHSGAGARASTYGRIHAGERLTRGIFEPSGYTGTFTGVVGYNPNVGPGGFTAPAIAPPGHERLTATASTSAGSILVGRFTITIP